jgi:DNA-binding NarL/FixJ family response regulator
MRILYVENHAVFAANVCRQFLSTHTVTVVPSLSDARRELASANFDLALVDYDLDDGKGDQLVRELASAHPQIISIGVSSHGNGNSALLRAGAAAVCSKMRFEDIQQVIESVFLGKDTARE